MQNIIFLFLVIAIVPGLKAQVNSQASVHISSNQIEVAYQHNVLHPKLWVEGFIGLGNQDFKSTYNDFLMGIHLGWNLFEINRNRLDLLLIGKEYFPNNIYYSAPTWVLGGGVRFSRFFGETEKHLLLLDLGYTYGKREYTQEFKQDDFSIATKDNFAIKPLYLAIGYGYRF